MESYLLDWANLLLRWLHVITAIAWIGSSFYFVWLDNSLAPPDDPQAKARGVGGELWSVHGGGFYNAQKYPVGPAQMPSRPLHWFYWESYSTWLSGFALFTVLYLWQADTFLVDRQRMDWSGTTAGGVALAFLGGGWAIYDGICRIFGRNQDGSIGNDARVLLLLFAAVVAGNWLACQVFSGRAAFLLMGATLATIMSANVLFWIIPGQRKVVADLQAGRSPDPVHGQRGKQRSVHNTYFTLPVLVAMLSNHYGMLYQHAHNWAVLSALMLAGAVIRQFFVARHKGRSPWGWVVLATALLGGVVWVLRPAPQTRAPAPTAIPTGAEVQALVLQRCVVCHNAQLANKGVALDTTAGLRQHAQAIKQQVLISQQMPLNNATGITEAERALLGRWVDAGAPLP